MATREYFYPSGSVPRKAGAVLATGRVSWTTNEDAAGYLHFAGYAGLVRDEKVLFIVRNASATVDIAVSYGTPVRLVDPTNAAFSGAVACTMTAVGDTVTCTAHELVVGDVISFTGTGGGVVVGTHYFVITTADADTFQFSTARGGGAFNITPDGTNAWAPEYDLAVRGSFTVEKYVAETTTTNRLGIEEVLLEGVGSQFRMYFYKSAATAAAFNVCVELRRA